MTRLYKLIELVGCFTGEIFLAALPAHTGRHILDDGQLSLPAKINDDLSLGHLPSTIIAVAVFLFHRECLSLLISGLSHFGSLGIYTVIISGKPFVALPHTIWRLRPRE